MRTHRDIYINVLKKWWIILLTGLIISAGLVYEKAIITNYVIKSGEVWYTKIISIENFGSLTHYDDEKKFKSPSYMTNYKTINNFIKNTEEEFDYKQFCLNWDNKSETERYKWVQRHFIINDFGGGIYELCFRLGNNEPKELDYVLKNGRRYLKKYFNYSKAELEKIDKDIRFKELSKFEVVPQEKVINKNYIIKKYALIGFVLGVLVATFVVVIDALRKENVRR